MHDTFEHEMDLTDQVSALTVGRTYCANLPSPDTPYEYQYLVETDPWITPGALRRRTIGLYLWVDKDGTQGKCYTCTQMSAFQ